MGTNTGASWTLTVTRSGSRYASTPSSSVRAQVRGVLSVEVWREHYRSVERLQEAALASG